MCGVCLCVVYVFVCVRVVCVCVCVFSQAVDSKDNALMLVYQTLEETFPSLSQTGEGFLLTFEKGAPGPAEGVALLCSAARAPRAWRRLGGLA